MGIKLFVHSVRLVLDNFREALRISALLYILPVLLGLVLLGTLRQSELANFVVGAIQLAATVFVAVAWHRFVLLDAGPAGLLPELNVRRTLTYLGCSVIVVLMILPIMIAGVFLAVFLSAIGGPILSFLGVLPFILASLTVSYRLGVILPASSVGRKLKLREAWEATRGATGDVLVLAFVSALGSVLIGLPSLLFTGWPLVILGFLWSVAAQWLVLLVNVSLLTTLYGHYVEGRPVGGSAPRAGRAASEPDFS